MGCPLWLLHSSAQRPHALALVPLFRTPFGASRKPVVLAASSGRSLLGVVPSFLDEFLSLDARKTLFESTKNTLLSAPKPLSETLIDAIDHFTSVMGSLLSGQGLLRKTWCCARGWWMVAGGHRIIAGDALNVIVLSCLSTPTHRHTLVTYTLIDNRTTSTVDKTCTTIEP